MYIFLNHNSVSYLALKLPLEFDLQQFRNFLGNGLAQNRQKANRGINA